MDGYEPVFVNLWDIYTISDSLADIPNNEDQTVSQSQLSRIAYYQNSSPLLPLLRLVRSKLLQHRFKIFPQFLSRLEELRKGKVGVALQQFIRSWSLMLKAKTGHIIGVSLPQNVRQSVPKSTKWQLGKFRVIFDDSLSNFEPAVVDCSLRSFAVLFPKGRSILADRYHGPVIQKWTDGVGHFWPQKVFAVTAGFRSWASRPAIGFRKPPADLFDVGVRRFENHVGGWPLSDFTLSPPAIDGY